MLNLPHLSYLTLPYTSIQFKKFQRRLKSQKTLSDIGPGGYSRTLTIRVCAAGQGMVFRPSSLEKGNVNQENNVGNIVYNYIKLINSLIQVAINFF